MNGSNPSPPKKKRLKERLADEKESAADLKKLVERDRLRIKELPGLWRNLSRWWWRRKGL